jgi:hypothetical protein
MTVTIHVYLPDEGTDCWFPCRAEHLGGDLYRVLDEAPEDPVWEFNKGDVVRCRMQRLAEGTTYRDELVAFEKASKPNSP